MSEARKLKWRLQSFVKAYRFQSFVKAYRFLSTRVHLQAHDEAYEGSLGSQQDGSFCTGCLTGLTSCDGGGGGRGGGGNDDGYTTPTMMSLR